MKRNDSQFKLMVSQLQSGGINRAQACTNFSIEYGTLCVWLGRSKLNDSIPRPVNGKKLAGAALNWNTLSDNDKEALNIAAARVIGGEVSALQAAREDSRVNSRTLAAKVRKIKIEMGVPVMHR